MLEILHTDAHMHMRGRERERERERRVIASVIITTYLRNKCEV
jgi:hypothetical protein